MKFSMRYLAAFYILFIALFITSNSTLAVVQSAHSPSQEQQKSQSFQLLMVGGGLQICSELNIQNCNEAQATVYSEKQNSKTYRLSEDSFNAVLQTPGFQALPPSTQKQLTQVFQHFYANPLNVNSPEEIRQAFKATTQGFDASALFSNLPNEVYYAILDFTQQTVQTQIKVELSQSINKSTQNIIAEFAKQADLKREDNSPLQITYITAGFRDPFEKVEYYQQVFEQAVIQANIKEFSITWLPLDQNLIQALRDKAKGLNSCDKLNTYRQKNMLFNSETRYPALTNTQRELCETPEVIEKLLEDSQGTFITGGSTMRLMSLLRDPQFKSTVWQRIIHQNVKNGSLFLAGSDTGAAVIAGGIFDNRPIPLITGGKSEVALIRGAFAMSPAPFGCEKDLNCPFGLLEDDLTFESRGGIGSFDLGAVDTRFSEHGREARQVVLTAATKTRFGFGIDKNTGVLFRNESNGDKLMKIIGENGVFISDMRDAIVKTQAGKHQIIGMSHYVNHADQITYSASQKELSINFADESTELQSKTMILPLAAGEFRRNVAINCGTTTFHRWTENNIAWLINPTEETKFNANLSSDLKKCSYSNLLFGIEN